MKIIEASEKLKIIQAEAVRAQAQQHAKKKASELMAEAHAYAQKITLQAQNKAQNLTI